MKKLFVFLLFNFVVSIHLMTAQVSFAPASVPAGNNPTVLQLMTGILNHTNSSGFNVSLSLACSARGQVFATVKSKVFHLPAGSTEINLQNGEGFICPANVLDSANRILNYDIRTASFPPGNYEFCISVLTAFGGETLGKKCFSLNIENLPKVILLSPENKSTIHTIIPVFSWSKIIETGSVSPKGIRYTLRVVEIPDGQSPVTAMESNLKSFDEEQTDLSSFQYSSAKPFMEACRKYAWQVSAFEGTAQNKIRLTKSEIWSFTVDCDGGVSYTVRESSQTKMESQVQAKDTKYSETQITRTVEWPPQYVINSTDLIEEKDTLLLQVSNKYPTGSIEVSYYVANLTTHKATAQKTITLKADRKKVKFKIPCDETNVKMGETGVVIMYVGKETFYQKFIRVPEEEE